MRLEKNCNFMGHGLVVYRWRELKTGRASTSNTESCFSANTMEAESKRSCFKLVVSDSLRNKCLRNTLGYNSGDEGVIDEYDKTDCECAGSCCSLTSLLYPLYPTWRVKITFQNTAAFPSNNNIATSYLTTERPIIAHRDYCHISQQVR